MYVTEEPLLFIQTFLTGYKEKICNFIMADEGLRGNKQVICNLIMKDGLWLPPPPPSLLLEKSLKLKCARIVIDQFTKSPGLFAQYMGFCMWWNENNDSSILEVRCGASTLSCFCMAL
ncbi:hypothetical protein TCON_2770 [Astathelohania contejeani]|uniref:Uncharacterized protein n=1 Tax=Astathelohania contejeani TaxID=164912 RepID=A0ABQ7HV21_9MICR|nr:hypothetical protein TCON_2770 [Thelohania contejeani]